MKLDQFIALIPILGAYLVLYGAIDLLAYYGHFNVEIFSYVSISEVVLYFMKDLFYVASFILLLGTFLSLLIYYDNSKIYERQKLDAQALTERMKRSKKYLYISLIAYTILLVAVFLLNPTYSILLTLSSLFAFTAYLPNRDYRILPIVGLGLIMLSTSYVNANSRAKAAWVLAYGAELKIQGEEPIISDSSNYIIGKTEYYVFFHRSKLQQTVIYPVSRLDHLTIPSRINRPKK